MAAIRPFRGLRYSGAAGPIDDLVAPPYDVLSQEDRDAFAAKNPHNVVLLTLPEGAADDRSKFVKYARSSARLADWRRSGALEVEDKASFYRYTQTFTLPGTNKRFSRTAFISLIKLEPYDKGVVLPHEQTFPKHKEDRLRLLEATRSHLECIFGLFEDEGGTVLGMVNAARAETVADVTTDDGVKHFLEKIDDPATTAELTRLMENEKVWIADGHHRYETALTFRGERAPGDSEKAEDYMMMALASMSDPGLVLLPTHRIVHKMPVKGELLDDLFQRYFNVRKAPNSTLLEEIERLNREDTRAFGVALPGGIGLILTLDRPQDILDEVGGDGTEKLKLLDVTILHKVIFEKLLGLQGLDFFSYTRDSQEALDSVKDGEGAAFLMNPPTNEDMRQIALGGEKMPQKSTYYYPKILSGLVLWSLNDFES